jgi:hypothetical protein
MRFYIDGSFVGFSLSLWGLILLIYILFECYFYYKSKILLIQLFIINARVRINLKKSVPAWVKVNSVRFGMYTNDRFGKYITVPVNYEYDKEITSDDLKNYTSLVSFMGFVRVNRFGKRISNLNELYDNISDEAKKRYNRNSILEKILEK